MPEGSSSKVLTEGETEDCIRRLTHPHLVQTVPLKHSKAKLKDKAFLELKEQGHVAPS